jgi:hypothetical protein
MRITIGLAAIASVCLLAGCNKGAANNSANAPAPAANTAAPVEAATPPAETPAPGNAVAIAARRAHGISECVSGAPGHLPAGTDANAFCSCAVDKMIASDTPQRDAVTQCANEMHITIQGAE